MKQLLHASMLLLLGGTSYAATYEANKNKTPAEQTITGGVGEGILVLQSPKKSIPRIVASFRCESSCDLILGIFSDSVLDRNGQPVALLVDDVFKEGVPFQYEAITVKGGGAISMPGLRLGQNTSLEFVTFTIARSIKELKAMSMAKIKVGIGNYDTRTEVEIDARKFDLSRLMDN